MYQLKCFDKISKSGLKLLDSDFDLCEEVTNADVALVRSSDLHEVAMPKSMLAIARAGAGVNNIPFNELAEQGVVVFNTPGANANGVKELVLAGLLLASRDIVGGIEWVKTIESDVAKTAEKGKKAFAGNEILGKKLGVIGLGAIGVLVANAAISLGMDVMGYDTGLSIEHAIELNNGIEIVKDINKIYEECDYITIHVPLLDATKKMINGAAFSKMKDGVNLLNFARDALVDEEALKANLANGKVHRYITDFPNETVQNVPGILVIPHLGASTKESEDNCAMMAVREIMNYVHFGSIMNSVNFPNVELAPISSGTRITILHKNVPNMIGQFAKVFGDLKINITNMTNKSKGTNAYTVFDVESNSQEVEQLLNQIEDVYKVRIIQ